MMDRLRLYLIRHWPVILLALLTVFVVLVMWFRPGYIIYFWDQTFPLNPPENLRSLFTIWHSEYDFGRPDATAVAFIPYFLFITVFSFVAQSLSIAQILLYLLVMASSLIGMYFLVRYVLEIVDSNGRYQEWKFQCVGVVASLLYVFNPYTLFFEWRIVNATIFLMALLPWIYLVLLRHIRRPSVLNVAIFSLLVFFASPGLSNPTFIPILVLIGVGFMLLAWRSWADIKSILGLVAATVAVSCFWLVPVFLQVSSVQDAGSYGGVTTALVSNSRDLTMDNVIRLLGSSPITETYKGEPSFEWAQTYTDTFFTLLPFAALIVIFAGMSLIKIRYKKPILIFLGLFLLFLFASKSINAPFQDAFWRMFETIDFFRAYRDPFSKFGLGLLFSFVILFALVSAEIAKKLDRRMLLGLVVAPVAVATLAFNWPLLTGGVFRSEGPVRPSAYAKIPKEYSDVAAILKTENGGQRAISLPMSTSPLMSSHWESGFVGFDPVRLLSVQPVISTFSDSQELEAYKTHLYDLLQQPNDATLNAFGKLGLRWIIVRWDNNDAFDGTMTKEELRSITRQLQSNPEIKLRYDSERISLLELPKNTTPKEVHPISAVATAKESINKPVEYHALASDAITAPDNALLSRVPIPAFQTDVGDQAVTATNTQDATVITAPASAAGSVISTDPMDLSQRYVGVSFTAGQNTRATAAFSKYEGMSFVAGGEAALVGTYEHDGIRTELYDLRSLDFTPNRLHIHIASTSAEAASYELKSIFQTDEEGYASIKGAVTSELTFDGGQSNKKTHNLYAPWLEEGEGLYLAMDIRTEPGYSFFLGVSRMVNGKYVQGKQLLPVYSKGQKINEEGLHEATTWRTYYFRMPSDQGNYLNINVIRADNVAKNNDAVSVKNIRLTSHAGGPEDTIDFLAKDSGSLVANTTQKTTYPYAELTNREGVANGTVNLKRIGVVGLGERYSPDWHLYLLPIQNSTSCQPDAADHQDISMCAHIPSQLDRTKFELALARSNRLTTEHMQLNGLQNGWILDPSFIKTHFRPDYYRENPDGSITLNIAAHFAPQHGYTIGLLISGTALLGSLGYVLWYAGKRRMKGGHMTLGGHK